MAIWKCNSCGNTLDAISSPEICPSCGQKCEFVDVSCYIPDCGGAGSGGIDTRVSQEVTNRAKKQP